MCASIATQYQGKLAKSYHCTPRPVCKALELNNNCSTLTTDRDITACCCDGSSNCHVQEAAVNTTNIVPAVNFNSGIQNSSMIFRTRARQSPATTVSTSTALNLCLQLLELATDSALPSRMPHRSVDNRILSPCTLAILRPFAIT